MPYIPHTEAESAAMLAAIGVSSTEELFDEIPAELRVGELAAMPAALNEIEIAHLMEGRAAQDAIGSCFLGAGAYDHHIPAAVWEIVGRGEFYSAYTPYQAEASQGTLQLIYEYQSMMTALTAMDVANASLYDGASALAEAVLMAVRLNRKSASRRVLFPTTVHPRYRQVVQSLVGNQGIKLVDLPYDESGRVDPAALAYGESDCAALVISQPNFFGALEEVDELTNKAHANGLLVIAVVNPVALAILKPPGEWGETGADIVCGEGQPLGIPLSSGGPYFGFMACRQAHVRQMPGRIVGRTEDLDGKTGFTLTLQAREQHIRRSKATSNICTNQGLMVTAATISMAILGPEGLAAKATACHANTAALKATLTALDGVELVFEAPFFHEFVIRLAAPVAEILPALAGQNILAGLDLGNDYPELKNCLLVCATEKRTTSEIDAYVRSLKQLL